MEIETKKKSLIETKDVTTFKGAVEFLKNVLNYEVEKRTTKMSCKWMIIDKECDIRMYFMNENEIIRFAKENKEEMIKLLEKIELKKC